MPRLPVDGKKVVEHRITFGTKERDLMEGALVAFQFNRIATPILNALQDVSFLLFAGGVLAAYKYIDADTWNALTSGIAGTAATAEEAAVTIIEAGQQAYQVAQEARDTAADFGGDVTDFATDLPFTAGPIPANTLLGLARQFGLI
tara:strand:- start:1639 stop:2076 length:438 start_codon:yes stop_codon:yes gene_type:complete